MIDSQPTGKAPHGDEAWTFSASVIASIAVSVTLGLLGVAYLFAVAGGEPAMRLVLVAPIYFIGVFALAFAVFWALRGGLAWIKAALGDAHMGTGEHGAVVLLTFVIMGLLHYWQGAGLEEVDQARAARDGDVGVSAAELRDAEPTARLQAATSARLRSDAYLVLMRDRDPQVRLALARRPDLPAGMTVLLADDRHADIRAVVGASPKTGDETLRRLAYDREESVRLAVAGNKEASPAVLDILASSTPGVRAAVAANPRTARETLRALSADSSREVAQVAAARLGGS